MALEPLEISNKQLVFIPINNNQNPLSSGGSHWSLVVFNRSDETYYIYDSSNQCNIDFAKYTIKRMDPFVRTNSNNCQMKVIEKSTPQQRNGYDCGVYVLAITESIAKHSGSDDNLFNEVTPQVVTALRKRVLELIYEQWKSSK